MAAGLWTRLVVIVLLCMGLAFVLSRPGTPVGRLQTPDSTEVPNSSSHEAPTTGPRNTPPPTSNDLPVLPATDDLKPSGHLVLPGYTHRFEEGRGVVFTASANCTLPKPDGSQDFGKPSPPSAPTGLNDIAIIVKTTSRRTKRVDLILLTWFQQARDATFFLTDVVEQQLNCRTGYHLLSSDCFLVKPHSRDEICCKTQAEMLAFEHTHHRWLCHVDDDNYLNVPNLVALLRRHDHTRDVFLGRPTTKVYDVPNLERVASINANSKLRHTQKKVHVHYATGGAGWCVSRPLLRRLVASVRSNPFVQLCRALSAEDDISLSYLVAHRLGVPLTFSYLLHSHMEPLWELPASTLHEQVTLSYGTLRHRYNLPPLDVFRGDVDPYRMFSMHCYLFPETSPLCDGARTVALKTRMRNTGNGTV